MVRKKNILYRVAQENENTVTEIFVNLMRWKYIRDILLKGLNLGDFLNLIEYDDISTQVTILNKKRPDIVIENKDLVIFIENKIYKNTPLQLSQCTDYYEGLSKKKKKTKRMIFLIPKGYEHKDELADKNNYQDIETNIVYWTDLFDLLINNDIYEVNTSVKENIDFMLSALSLTDSIKKFTVGEVAFMFDSFTIQTVSKLLRKTEKYTNEVMVKILEKYKDTFNLNTTKYESSEKKIGTCIIDKNNCWVFLLGYIFDVPNKEGIIYFRIDNSIIKSKDQTEKIQYFEHDKWFFFPIPKEVLVNEENVPMKILLYVTKVIDCFCLEKN